MAASPEEISKSLAALAESVARYGRLLLALLINIDNADIAQNDDADIALNDDKVIDQLKKLLDREDELTELVDKVHMGLLKYTLLKIAIKTANIKLLQTLFIDGKFRHFIQGEQAFVKYKLTVRAKAPKDVEETEDVKEKAVLQRIRFFVDENRRLQPSDFASMLYEKADYKNVSSEQKNEIIHFLKAHCDVIQRTRKILTALADADVVTASEAAKDFSKRQEVTSTSVSVEIEAAKPVAVVVSASSSLAGPSSSSQTELDKSFKNDAIPDLVDTSEPKVISPRGNLPEQLSLLFSSRSLTPGRCSPNRSPVVPARPSSPVIK